MEINNTKAGSYKYCLIRSRAYKLQFEDTFKEDENGNHYPINKAEYLMFRPVIVEKFLDKNPAKKGRPTISRFEAEYLRYMDKYFGVDEFLDLPTPFHYSIRHSG